MSLKQNGAMSLKECAEGVYLWSKGSDVTLADTTQVTPHNGDERHNNDITPVIQQEMISMRELIEKQGEIIQTLQKQLEHQNAAQKERDRMLLHSIEKLQSDLQGQREEQLAIEEQVLPQTIEEKPSLWSRLFKK